MQTLREWLFTTVAVELSAKGASGLQIKSLAAAGGLDVAEISARYPHRRELLAALIDEVFAFQQELIYSQIEEAASARERAVRFIERSLDFVYQYPLLAEVLVLALLGSSPDLKDQVHDRYAFLVAPLLPDLLAEHIIPDRSALVVADLSEILLTVIYLGGCPGLQMDYLSFVDARKIAISTLAALHRRYQIQRA
jgi:hypothetical protein